MSAPRSHQGSRHLVNGHAPGGIDLDHRVHHVQRRLGDLDRAKRQPEKPHLFGQDHVGEDDDARVKLRPLQHRPEILPVVGDERQVLVEDAPQQERVAPRRPSAPRYVVGVVAQLRRHPHEFQRQALVDQELDHECLASPDLLPCGRARVTALPARRA